MSCPFPGIVESLQHVSLTDITADLEAQHESVVDDSDGDEKDEAIRPDVDIKELRQQISKASNSTTEGTQKEYELLQNAFLVWLNSSSYWTKDTPFFTDRPHPDSPALIVAWIMSRCDSKDAQGRVIPTAQIRQSYSYAQKMRAAMTHAFGHNHRLGKAKWHKDDRGTWKGNPSVSDTVSGYLYHCKGNQTCKLTSCFTAVSETSIQETLKKIYDFNQAENRSVPTPYVPGRRKHNGAWGSPRVRLQTYALMLICFWCLLRSDEAVRITFDDLEFIPADATTPSSFELTLRWRKTDQFGQVKPFRLYMRDECEAYLCPVRAIAAWILSARKESGPLFRKMNSGDRVSDEPLASDTFLEWFRNCLVDVDVYPFPYGTHSFRRGGCQFLSAYLRWGPRKIADWGGWSTEFSWVTIVTYLISWADSEIIERENFLRPGMQPVLLCTVCGRNCGCGGAY
ncbi:hypothetical protein R3P38DRAFT_2555486 [Favolaschia claudopus]|uniref:Tyr recombinase domain-containing protein n=1 Tax=Favolaschia claudopus TaxID=2862362 RepID=A0AAW0AC63_9AGAR